jgi:23S rRNA pseudouridine955/2504/2580 synthase
MSIVQNIRVAPDEADQRIDRWLRGHFPQVSLSQLQKWLRTGQVRVDGRRVKPGVRLALGQEVRVPPAAQDARTEPKRPAIVQRSVSSEDADVLRARVLYRDDLVIAIDKPAGLAVQGGSRTYRHLDGMLDALTFDASERPRLVHRLDKDTSGVLLLARDARAAAELTAAFRSKTARKLYWAIVVGYPNPLQGRISAPLIKMPGERGERVEADGEAGREAVTFYRTIDRASRRATWLALEPRTGRTHQLRVHCAQILGTPILGDGKYGGATAFLSSEGLGRGLHLHARGIRMPHRKKGLLEVFAPLPPHMAKTMTFLGLDPKQADSNFSADLD